MTTGFVPRNTVLVDEDGRMTEAWYRYFQDLYQWSGLAGSNFPLYASALCPALAMVRDGVSPPAVASVGGSGNALAFAAGVTERAHFTLILPHGYTSGSELVPVVRSSPSTTGAGVVRWVLDYSVASVGSAYSAPASVILDTTAEGEAIRHQHIAGDGIDGAGLRGGAVALCSIYRDGAAPEDTYPDDVYLLAAGFAVQNSAHGSQTVRP